MPNSISSKYLYGESWPAWDLKVNRYCKSNQEYNDNGSISSKWVISAKIIVLSKTSFKQSRNAKKS